ncbi:MAG: putative toxin-antitoxin system toxin component, PIN family [Chloroflexi bacterium]|nr:putative toxin-antitoxin system toxin component, PIN family [Chloroflexota bacterium]
MRVVLDANVLISGFISPRGSPAAILRLWEEGAFELVTSAPILAELERVIHYPRIQQRYHLPEEAIREYLDLISGQAILVEPQGEIHGVERDITDNRYLECAVAANARYIVSGDAHLLDLGSYGGVEILSPAGFLAVLRADGGGRLGGRV